MSNTYCSGDHPLPLRWIDISNVFIELLALSQWGALHVFGLDLALGLGEVALYTIRLSKVVAFFLITTPRKIAFKTIRKLIQVYTKPHARNVGVVENMKIRDTSFIEKLSERAWLILLERDILWSHPWGCYLRRGQTSRNKVHYLDKRNILKPYRDNKTLAPETMWRLSFDDEWNLHIRPILDNSTVFDFSSITLNVNAR